MVEASRKSGSSKGKSGLKQVGRGLAGINWAIWALIIAALLNFIQAITTGSLISMLACIAVAVGLAGVIRSVD